MFEVLLWLGLCVILLGIAYLVLVISHEMED